MTMNSDSFAGAAKEVAGKIEKTAGDLAGHAGAQIKGATDELAGRTQDAYGRLAETVAASPLVSLLVTGAVCYALGLLSRRH
jgi:uncharacterized protein YjbJ (UPF0337 family)